MVARSGLRGLGARLAARGRALEVAQLGFAAAYAARPAHAAGKVAVEAFHVTVGQRNGDVVPGVAIAEDHQRSP